MRRFALARGLLMALWLTPLCLPADLETEARAILQRRCLACHGPPARVAGLDLSSRESALRGASKGPALKPGSPAESLLLNRVVKGEMPPTGPLPAPEADALRRWIE